MPDYEVIFTRSARKALQHLPASVSDRIIDKIEVLAKEPRRRGVNRLKETSDHWRMRVGDYRVIYRIDDHKRIIDVMLIRHRDVAYR